MRIAEILDEKRMRERSGDKPLDYVKLIGQWRRDGGDPNEAILREELEGTVSWFGGENVARQLENDIRDYFALLDDHEEVNRVLAGLGDPMAGAKTLVFHLDEKAVLEPHDVVVKLEPMPAGKAIRLEGLDRPRAAGKPR